MSVELGHGDRLWSGPAGPALQGVLYDQGLGALPVVAPVDFEHIRPSLGVVLAQPTPTESACASRSLDAEPAAHCGMGGQRLRVTVRLTTLCPPPLEAMIVTLIGSS
jgi:hypothetical protein